MSRLRKPSRCNFVDPSYASLPALFRAILNAIACVASVTPYLSALVPWFAVIWGASRLQPFVDHHSALEIWSVLITVVETGSTMLTIELLSIHYSMRRAWDAVLRQTVRDVCEGFLRDLHR